MNVTALGDLVAAIRTGFLALYAKIRKLAWEIERRYKWRQLRPEIDNISSVHDRTSGSGKKVSLLEKGRLKKSLTQSADKYDEYIKFCEDKGLALPARDDEINEMIDQSLEVLDLQRALDRELDRAKREYDEAYTLAEGCGKELLSERDSCIGVLEDAQQVVNSIARHPKSFAMDIGRVSAQCQTFADTKQFAEEREGELKAAVGGVAAGVAAGAGVATLAPGASRRVLHWPSSVAGPSLWEGAASPPARRSSLSRAPLAGESLGRRWLPP